MRRRAPAASAAAIAAVVASVRSSSSPLDDGDSHDPELPRRAADRRPRLVGLGQPAGEFAPGHRHGDIVPGAGPRDVQPTFSRATAIASWWRTHLLSTMLQTDDTTM